MTEAEWLACADPVAMLAYVHGKISARKFRLFACACCRRVAHLIRPMRNPGLAKVVDYRQVVEAAEQAADGLLTAAELAAIHKSAEKAKPLSVDGSWAAAWSAVPDATEAAEESAEAAAQAVANLAVEDFRLAARAASVSGAPADDQSSAWDRVDALKPEALAAERREQAVLLREIAGNPFRPLMPREPLPLTVAQLAESLYGGEDCAFALHDALLEAGHTELAEHFREGTHPKGCWALDLILERT